VLSVVCCCITTNTDVVKKGVCELSSSSSRDRGNSDVGTANGSSTKTTSRGVTLSLLEDEEDKALH
jgi:hypothetical protein